MDQVKVRAIITRTLKWSDTSKIITLFSGELGRIDLIAKGARNPRSNYQGILETLNLIEAVVSYSTKRELQILGKVSLEASFPGIRADLKKTGYALSIIELINIFILYDQKDSVFFDFLIYIIEFIETNHSEEIAFWYFILKLTSYLGFKPEFSECRQCKKNIFNGDKYFSFSTGSVVCRECVGDQSDSRRIPSINLAFLARLQGTHYRRISQIKLPDSGSKQITLFLLDYLKYHTDQKFTINSLTLIEGFEQPI